MPSEEYEVIPVWYDVKKKIGFDKSTKHSRLLVIPPATPASDQVLNNSGSIIRFDYNPAANQYIHMASDKTGFRCRFYYFIGTTGLSSMTGIPANLSAQGNEATIQPLMNPFANTCLESSFWGNLFLRQKLLMSGQQLEEVNYFQPYFQTISHLQPLDFKLKHGSQIGYFPDEVSAVADDTQSLPPIYIQPFAAAAANAATTFYLVVAPTISVALGSTYITPLTSNGNKIILTPALAAAVAGQYSPFYIQTLNSTGAAIAAAGAYNNFPIGNGLTITLTAVAQVNNNTSGNFYINMNYGPAVALATNYIWPYATACSPNFNFEPAFLRRKTFYNLYPIYRNGTLVTEPPYLYREVEVFIPLHLIFGFCRDYDRITYQVSFQIEMQRDTSINPMFGGTGTDGYIVLKSMNLELDALEPNDEIKVRLNRELETPVEVAFLATGGLSFSETSASINRLVNNWFRPDFMIIVFKDATIVSSSTTNSIVNTHANMQSLQILIGGELYPNTPQLADFPSNKFAYFYERFKQVCIALTGECSMTVKEYLISPVFAFDLRAQDMQIKNTIIPITIQGTRNVNVPTTVNMYVYTFYEKYYKAEFLKNLITPAS